MALLKKTYSDNPPSDSPWAGAWLLGVILASSLGLDNAVAQSQMEEQVERGRYLIRTSGCNDCHTPGYPESGGTVDEQQWLIGSDLGWRGPWGTTYASNLRQVVQSVSEEQWLSHARNAWRPPMPWFNLRDMSDGDLRAIYRYIEHLGVAGRAAPAYVPPGQEPLGAYVQFPSAP